jgi:hypothetical protein
VFVDLIANFLDNEKATLNPAGGGPATADSHSAVMPPRSVSITDEAAIRPPSRVFGALQLATFRHTPSMMVIN